MKEDILPHWCTVYRLQSYHNAQIVTQWDDVAKEVIRQAVLKLTSPLCLDLHIFLNDDYVDILFCESNGTWHSDPPQTAMVVPRVLWDQFKKEIVDFIFNESGGGSIGIFTMVQDNL